MACGPRDASLHGQFATLHGGVVIGYQEPATAKLGNEIDKRPFGLRLFMQRVRFKNYVALRRRQRKRLKAPTG